MSRTRLAAALGVAALTLGATAAVADDDDDAGQTVTINVTAAPREITVGTPTSSFSVVAGAVATGSTNSNLAYKAGPTGDAKITVEIDAAGNGLASTALTLGVVPSGMDGSGGTAVTTVTLDKDTVVNTPVDLVTGIDANEIVNMKTVNYSLGGTAPSTAGTHLVDLVFTITDDNV
jgi:hypothetical protein